MRRLACLSAAVIGLGCTPAFFHSATAHAEYLSILNSSFENPFRSGGNISLGVNGDSNNAIAGWDINGTFPITGGVFANTTDQFASLPDGNQFAYIGTRTTGDHGTLSLTTSVNSLPAIVAGTAYTLTVAVGHRLDNVYPAGSVAINILANGSIVSTNTVNAQAITPGTFVDVATTLSAAQTLLLGGQQLAIEIVSTNTSSVGNTHNEAAIDNVRLFASAAVPEPASLGLLAAGASALLLKRRRRA